MSMISSVQSSAAYLQAIATVTSLAAPSGTDSTTDMSGDPSDGSMTGTAMASSPFASSNPTDTVGNHLDTFA